MLKFETAFHLLSTTELFLVTSKLFEIECQAGISHDFFLDMLKGLK